MGEGIANSYWRSVLRRGRCPYYGERILLRLSHLGRKSDVAVCASRFDISSPYRLPSGRNASTEPARSHFAASNEPGGAAPVFVPVWTARASLSNQTHRAEGNDYEEIEHDNDPRFAGFGRLRDFGMVRIGRHAARGGASAGPRELCGDRRGFRAGVDRTRL